MVRQLALPIEVMGAETVQESDGLAMSSRDTYLSAAERVESTQLHVALRQIADAVRTGGYEPNEFGAASRDRGALRA